MNYFDFFYHLRDTAILLGMDARFADLLKTPEVITEADVVELRKYTGKLIDETKHKLININRLTVSRG